jgi:ABC-type dipeptide/oligopeptide/nickel transport system permease component
MIFLYGILIYVAIGVLFGIYLYYNTKKDRKFRELSLQIAVVAGAAWPIFITLIMLADIYDRFRR